jgi:hypothetical protein
MAHPGHPPNAAILFIRVARTSPPVDRTRWGLTLPASLPPANTDPASHPSSPARGMRSPLRNSTPGGMAARIT